MPIYSNISSVVEFQRWWVLKSKLFAQKSTCSKEILIPTTLNHLWFSVDRKKSEFLKLIVLLLHYFGCQIWVQWHKLSGKNTYIFFFYFWFKNKQVWAEKIGKKRKPKSFRQLPLHLIHLVFQVFPMENQNNQL